jgi:hypothetical protein
LIHQSDTHLGCQVDHVVSEKHGGATEADNLAFSCALCNRAKGTDLGSRTVAGEFVRFFNPRADRWEDHFHLQGSMFAPKTAIGEVTIKILQLNATERIMERDLLMRIGRY